MYDIKEEMLGYLMHYGTPRHSGRYPWGSGEDPYQHDSSDFLGRIETLKKSGWAETPENIKNEFGMTTTQYRAQKSLAKDQRRTLLVDKAKSLKDDGLSTTEIGRQLGVNESTVRSWFNSDSERRMRAAENVAAFIKEQVDTKGMIDVGSGVEAELNISKEKLKQALTILEEQGYHVFGGRTPQPNNPTQMTTLKMIAPPDTPYKINSKGQKVSSAIYDPENYHTLTDYVSHDNGDTFDTFVYPKSMDSKRLAIRYAEDGGIAKDGIVEIRRGVQDLSLGNDRYSQVRILVDGTHYIKGMAVYSDDMPDGVDVVFNTNKSSKTSKMDVLKEIKADPENPFGSLIKAGGQSYYTDKDGNRQLSLINKRASEGDWTEWKDALPSQFLSKQSLTLAKKQLKLALTDKADEYSDIMALTQPTVKKYFLNKFAEECDAQSVSLQAAALPGQKYHVIIPINTLKDNEVYAPRYENGTKLALIRYPHGGTFEIPILTVNNKNKLAKDVIGDSSSDAVGITHKVAEQLSGADFDGDTVMCIPTHDSSGKVKIASKPYLKQLEGYEPKAIYGADEVKTGSDGEKHYYRDGAEYKVMKKNSTGLQMGKISNLITDMTIQGAPDSEIARAVKHSMTVIDAAKHKLDYKQSEKDNGIDELVKKYQVKVDEDGNVTYGGASTLISKAKGQAQVDKRQGTPVINIKGSKYYDPTRPEGALIYKTADDVEYSYVKTNKKTGEQTVVTERRHQKSTQMEETDDARTLISEADSPMERAYADYANQLKAMANTARIEYATMGTTARNTKATKEYAAEVKSLNEKLTQAKLNAPRERAAIVKTNADIAKKKTENPDMSKEDIRKATQQALTKNRAAVGSIKRRDRNIKFEGREWEAVLAGAVSENVLNQILNNSDTDELRKLATPKATTVISAAKRNRIKSMAASNYSLDEIAKKLGLSTSTVSKYLKGV